MPEQTNAITNGILEIIHLILPYHTIFVTPTCWLSAECGVPWTAGQEHPQVPHKGNAGHSQPSHPSPHGTPGEAH